MSELVVVAHPRLTHLARLALIVHVAQPDEVVIQGVRMDDDDDGRGGGNAINGALPLRRCDDVPARPLSLALIYIILHVVHNNILTL